MSWSLFIIVLTVSFIIVRIGAIAFQMTGLEWSLAKFQSLSCFTGTGFTTKEAELITGNRQRRQIASVLMVLGNAGLVIMVASLAASLNPKYDTIITKLSKSFLPFTISPQIAMLINSLIIILVVYAVYKLFTNPKFFINKNSGIIKTCAGIIIVIITIKNVQDLPLNLNFANVYPTIGIKRPPIATAPIQ